MENETSTKADKADKPEEKDADQLEESELEKVAGGTEAFSGQYLVTETTHTTTRVNKVDALTIKQK
jgi:hypothetical protein